MAGALGCDFPSASIGILTGPVNNSSGAQLPLQLEGRFGSLSSFNSTLQAGATLTGDVTLDGTEPTFLRYNPNGADKNVKLPAAAAAFNGQIRRVSNCGSANNIVVKDAAAAVTFATLASGESTVVICLYNGSAYLWMVA